MTHRNHSIPKTLFAGLLILGLTAAAGFAQPKAETTAAAADPVPAAGAGVLVIAVQPGSPAEKAGIARGDIILEASGTAVNDAQELRKAFAGHASGDKVPVKLRHGDAVKTLSVTVGTWDGRPWIGVLPLPGRGPGVFGYEGGPGMMDGEDFGYGMRGFGPGAGGPGMMGRDGPMFGAEGALVDSVSTGSPAEKAGLKKGDLILSVDGTRVDARNSLADMISARKVGDTITLSVTSRGEDTPRELKVTLEKNPAKDAPFLGVQYMAAPHRYGDGLPGSEAGPGMMQGPGALVLEVFADGPAAKAGVQPRDIVTKVDGAPVTTLPQVVEAVAAHKPGDTLALTVVRGPEGKHMDISVTLGSNPKDATKAWLGIAMSGLGTPGMMRNQSPTPPSAPGANTPTL
jgi:S1-C subfamily serine protease